MSRLAPGSLAEAMYRLLEQYSPRTADAFRDQFVSSPFYYIQDEIGALNGFWKEQLGRLHGGAREARTWLCDAADPYAWLDSFEIKVLPVIIQHRLPQRI